MAIGRFPRRRPGTAFRSFDDEGLVVVSDRSTVNVVNEVGTKVLGLLDGKHTVEQIAENVSREFDVSAEAARRDVEAFLEELDRHGILESDEVSA